MSEPVDVPQRPVALPAPSDLLGLGPRAGDLIAHATWNEARERVIALVDAGPALIALLGPPGAGKTVLLRHLAATFREAGRAVCLLSPGDSSVDVGSAEIVLLDEADRISGAELEEYLGHSGIAVIFGALPDSRKRFELYPGVSVVELPRLSTEEACKFVAARLAQLGLPKACLTEAAWAQLIAQGQGVPRLLLGVLGSALFVAAEEHAACVTGFHVEEAVAVRGGSPEAIVAEPAPEQLDVAADTEPDAPPPPPRAGRIPSTIVVGLYLAAVVALYAVPTAAWLHWSAHRHADKAAAPGLRAPTMVAAQTPLPAPAETQPAAAIAEATATSQPPTAEAGSTGRGAAGAAGLSQSTPAPKTVASGPNNAAAVNTAPKGEAPATTTVAVANPPSAELPSGAPPAPAEAPSAGEGGAGIEGPAQSAPASKTVASGPNNAAAVNTAPKGKAPATATVVMANPPSAELPSAAPSAPAEHPALPPLRPRWWADAASVPDQGETSTDASVIDQRSASVGIAERSDWDAKIAHSTRHAEATVPEPHQAKSQSKKPSDRFVPPSWHVAKIQGAVAEHQAQARQAVPVPEVAFMPRPTINHLSLPVRQLLSARQALVENNSTMARDLLEAAQTTIVFEADSAPERSGVAEGQIVNALSLLNSGNTMRAVPYLDRAIIAIQPTS